MSETTHITIHESECEGAARSLANLTRPTPCGCVRRAKTARVIEDWVRLVRARESA